MRQLMTLLLALFLASASWSQDAEEPGDADAEASDTTEASEANAAEEDDSELDEQGYAGEEEEDDFIPSQEVSADQSLAFPVDI